MPAEKTQTLDLENWRGGRDNRVLAGRDSGEDVRQQARVGSLDTAPDPVEVRVPRDLFSVTSSFFLGLFGESIRQLGPDRFRAHYHFTGKPIDRVIQDALRSVALTTPLR